MSRDDSLKQRPFVIVILILLVISSLLPEITITSRIRITKPFSYLAPFASFARHPGKTKAADL
jgi:hypothetical protein